MAEIDFLVDTDVLIGAWRGDQDIRNELNEFAVGIDTVAKLEFLQGANKNQLRDAVLFVNRFEFIPFSPEVSFQAEILITEFAHLKGLRMGDALVASCALVKGVPLYTLNRRHFDFIDRLTLI